MPNDAPLPGFGLTVTATCGNARRGQLQTAHGLIDTPAFMSVGTYGAVRAMTPAALRETGAQIILSNALHLYLRPGMEVVEAAGGLHRMMGWEGPILTDSGGFQLMSLQELLKIDDSGADLRSPVDGSKHRISPTLIMDVQRRLGVDIAMVLDHCPAADVSAADKLAAMERSTRWAQECLEQPRAEGQAVFGIVQGGTDLALRESHLETIAALNPDGLALGGLAVGEGPEEMDRVVGAIAPQLPTDKPHYLMGVGYPRDLVASVRSGIDMFDCVVPTRHARNGQLFTRQGRINIANAVHRLDPAPIDATCDCPACTTHSRAYLRHLYQTKDILFSILATTHNLRFYQRLMAELRTLIEANDAEGMADLQSQAANW